MVRVIDADDSGSIDWKEFLYLMSKKYADGEADDQYLRAFRFFDTEDQQEINVSSFCDRVMTLTKQFTREEIQEIAWSCKFEYTDYSHLTYPEFVKLLMD